MYGALLKVCSALPETSLWARTALAARAAKKPAKDGVMATKVRKGHTFDETKLLGYLRAELGSGPARALPPSRGSSPALALPPSRGRSPGLALAPSEGGYQSPRVLRSP